MIYRIGQRVRLLHQTGEGVITDLIDSKNVEVDLGEDFPLEVHIDDIVPVDNHSKSFYSVKDPNQEKAIGSFGNVFELSLAVTQVEEKELTFKLINPEPVNILYTCYIKHKNKYQGMALGQIGHKEFHELFSLRVDEVQKIKSFYFQLLSFKRGTGHPHAPETIEFPWSKQQLQKPSTRIEAIKQKGWIFSLRKSASELEKALESAKPLLKVEKTPTRREKVIDLHIEELVEKPHQLAPSEMLRIQTKKAEKELSKALEENCGAIVFIHGVGNGTLKKEIITLLRSFTEVQEIHPGNPSKYGNGATRALLE
ncbi:MAG: Smr/MutS family protein [Bacteroidota bacterium]